MDCKPLPQNCSTPVHVIGADPGQVKIASYARCVLDPTKTAGSNIEDFTRPSTVSSTDCFPSRKYRFESLMRLTEKVEKSRVVGQYKEALQQMSQVSLKAPGAAVDYAEAAYATLDIRVAELMSKDRRRRRFARLRARERNLHHMATAIAYGAEQKAIRNRRGKAKRKLKKQLYAEPRVVFFGHAQFGHGSRGPCPRKALLRRLAFMVPVVLLDEFRTSARCYSCFGVLTQGSRPRVLRCQNSRAGVGNPCSVQNIDRDTNAAVNIGALGMRMLLGVERPRVLRRKKTPRFQF